MSGGASGIVLPQSAYTHYLPVTDAAFNLGSSTKRWNELHLSSAIFFTVSASGLIAVNTSDGTDNKILKLAGAGGAATNRGAYIEIGGNESSLSGSITYNAGDIAGGIHKFYSGASLRWSVDSDITQDVTNGGNIILTKGQTSVRQPIHSAISAAGSTISDATQLTGVVNQISTVSAGQGVKLWGGGTGTMIFVYNGGVTGVYVYPESGSISINGNGNGNPITVASGYCALLFKSTSSRWNALYSIQAS